MSTSEEIAEAIILIAHNSPILREKFKEIARDSEDKDYRYVAGSFKEWFLEELDNYEVRHSDDRWAENPDEEVEQMQLLYGGFLRSAVQTLSDDGWNKISQHFLGQI